jgi:hypothetical protein
VERTQSEKFIVADRGPVVKKQGRGDFKVHEQVSPCEKTVMLAYKDLQRKTRLIESNFSLFTDSPGEAALSIKAPARGLKPPLNSVVEKLDFPSSNVLPDRLSEWEKSHFEKIFKTLDDFAKTKTIKRDSLLKLFDIMEKDETFLGKVPKITKDEFTLAVGQRLREKKELSYLTFRQLLDDFGWRTLAKAESQARVTALYEQAGVLLRGGKAQDAINECAKALSLSRYH